MNSSQNFWPTIVIISSRSFLGILFFVKLTNFSWASLFVPDTAIDPQIIRSSGSWRVFAEVCVKWSVIREGILTCSVSKRLRMVSYRQGHSIQASKNKWEPSFGRLIHYWPCWSCSGHPTKPRTKLLINSGRMEGLKFLDHGPLAIFTSFWKPWSWPFSEQGSWGKLKPWAAWR